MLPSLKKAIKKRDCEWILNLESKMDITRSLHTQTEKDPQLIQVSNNDQKSIEYLFANEICIEC